MELQKLLRSIVYNCPSLIQSCMARSFQNFGNAEVCQFHLLHVAIYQQIWRFHLVQRQADFDLHSRFLNDMFQRNEGGGIHKIEFV